MAQPSITHTARSPKSTKAPAGIQRLHSLFETIVLVDVGPDQIRYAIYKGLLCSRSDYFRAALTGSFHEAENQVVTLDDEDPETFRIFNAWLYTNVLEEDPNRRAISWRALFNLYVFAEKRMVPLLKNAIVDVIIRADPKTEDGIPPPKEIRYVWARTAETSPLRKLLVDMMFFEEETLGREFKNRIDEYDIAFVAAVAIRAAELITMEFDNTKSDPVKKKGIHEWLRVFGSPWESRCQRYHIHDISDAPCEARM